MVTSKDRIEALVKVKQGGDKVAFSAMVAEARAAEADVPCAGCNACCKQDIIYLLPAEQARFQWHMEDGEPVLDRKPTGECIYLTDRGCGVHDDPPDICKRFDCRVLFLRTPKAKRRAWIEQNPTMRDVFAAAKKRLPRVEA